MTDTLENMLDDAILDLPLDDASDLLAFAEQCRQAIRQVATDRGFPRRQAELATAIFDRVVATRLAADHPQQRPTVH